MQEYRVSRKKIRQRRRKNLLLGCLIAGICLLGAGGWLIDHYLIPNGTHVDLNQYYAAEAGRMALVIQDHKSSSSGAVREDKVYIPLSAVQAEIDDRYYWDGSEILYALPTEVAHIPASAETYILEDGVPSLSLEMLQQYSGITWKYLENPQRVFIWNRWGEIPYAVCGKKSELRTEASIKGEILQDLEAGTGVAVLEEGDGWVLAQSEEGNTGYVKSADLGETAVWLAQSPVDLPEYTSLNLGEPVCLVWHQVTNQESNAGFSELISRTEGVNVVSPTWFTVQDTAGNLLSFADKEYVEIAHSLGLQVWALVGNLQVDIDDYAMLSNTQARENTIAQLMQAAGEYGFDGINLDFEALKKECEGHYIEFVRELSAACRKEGLIFSIDNYVPTAGTAFYDREEQAAVADYVIVMGYDEHWSGGPEAGSTASLPFVKKGIEDTLESVPPEKLINGIPFYTRLWEEGADGLSSTAKGMDEARAILEQHGAEIVWKEDLSQYYGEYWENDRHYQIWLEDSRSVKAKLDVMKEYSLAGVACWKLGLESEDVWPVIGEYLTAISGGSGT